MTSQGLALDIPTEPVAGHQYLFGALRRAWDRYANLAASTIRVWWAHSGPMSRKPTARYGVAPRERPPAKTPRALKEVPRTPHGNPMAQASLLRPHVNRPPKPHRVGAPPRPRRPRLVRDVDGGAFLDLFRIFPELPWPLRPPGEPAPSRDAVRGRMARRALTRRLR